MYRARDLFGLPGLLSLLRLPLAAAFPFALAQPLLALSLLAAAGLSDVIDGWYARRYSQVTATGTALDPVTDKVFVGVVAVTLVSRGFISPADLLLLGARDIGELPLVVWIATSRGARRLRASQPAANLLGKAATSFQFVAVSCAILRLPHLQATMITAGVFGVIAATGYWIRALRDRRVASKTGH